MILADLWLFIKGIGIGFAVAAPVGPIGMLCIRTTLERGRLAGLAAGLGAATADTLFAATAALSLSAVSNYLIAHRRPLEFLAGLFMIGLGARLGLKKGLIQENGAKPVPAGLRAEFLATLGLTLANPITILSFVGIFAGFAGVTHLHLSAIPVLLLAIFLGACLWWLSLCEGVGLIRHHISTTGMTWMNRIAGLLLVGFGVVTLYRLLRVSL